LAPGQVNDIIIDNVDAAVTGSWQTGTTSTDKYDINYRCNSQGTGSAYLVFNPNILTAGDYNVYEWHPAGGNRATDTPHIITYNGGTATINVNQQTLGGRW